LAPAAATISPVRPSESVEVLVVGAGPSGLFAAVELARHGVLARVVEREPEPHHEARATALQPGTLDIVERAGVVNEVLDASVHLSYARVFDAELAMVSELAFAGAGCRWECQCCLPQWRTERILAQRLEQLGGSVERGVEVESLDRRDDAIVLGLRHTDGVTENTEAGYVLGAGGAHSITRATMEETLTGETYPGTALVADVRLRCRVPRDGSSLVGTPGGYVVLAPLPDDRWITFIGDLGEREAERLATDHSTRAVTNALKHRIAAELRLDEVAWAALFRMHRRLVARMAGPRRFLLGDAGHLSSPFGGEGLNSGLHDAHNLGWKLALVVHGHGRRCLLDSFGSERLAADRHVLEVSDRLHALAQGAVEQARTGIAPTQPTPEQIASLVRSRTMLDVSYASSALAGEYLAPGDERDGELVPGDRYPLPLALDTCHQLLLFGPAEEAGVARLRRRWAKLVEVIDANANGLPASGAVLVRPDGHIGFCASRSNAAGLAAIDQHLESYLIAP
jgi:2-polyprenyl-6-methoxyphenol hydroxylase-like FAD-dependent oxidoreductase